MSDKKLADAIRQKAEELAAAMENAAEAGLYVEVSFTPRYTVSTDTGWRALQWFATVDVIRKERA